MSCIPCIPCTPCVEKFKESVSFMLNNKILIVHNPDPTLTLFNFLLYYTNFNCQQKIKMTYVNWEKTILSKIIDPSVKRIIQLDGSVIDTTDKDKNGKTKNIKKNLIVFKDIFQNSCNNYNPITRRIVLNQKQNNANDSEVSGMSIYTCLPHNCLCYSGFIKDIHGFCLEAKACKVIQQIGKEVNEERYKREYIERYKINMPGHYYSNNLNIHYYVVDSLARLKELMREYPTFRLISQATDMGLHMANQVFIDISKLGEMNRIEKTMNQICIGCNRSLKDFVEILEGHYQISELGMGMGMGMGMDMDSLDKSLGGIIRLYKFKNVESHIVDLLLEINAKLLILDMNLETKRMDIGDYLELKETKETNLLLLALEICYIF